MCHLLGIHLNFEDNLMELKDQTLLMKEYPSDANLSTLNYHKNCYLIGLMMISLTIQQHLFY